MTPSAPYRTLKELLTAQEEKWLLRGANSKIFGPVPQVMLLKAVLRGGISEQALVHPVGQPEWRPICDYPRLMAALARLQTRVSGVHGMREEVLANAPPRPSSARRSLSPPPRRASGE